MVQFGGSIPAGGIGSNVRRTLLIRKVRSMGLSVRKILFALVLFFALRNLFRIHYQEKNRMYVRKYVASGFPKTASEWEEYATGLEQVKKDIAYLYDEIDTIKRQQASMKADTSESERDKTTKSMDQLHEEKRKRREAQLLRDHPDFKPSKRLKDMDHP